MLFLILILNPYSILQYGKIYVLNTSYYPSIIKDIVDFEQLHEGKYFCFDFYGSVVGVFPYLKNKGINIYNIKGKERTEFVSLASTFDLKRVVLYPKDFFNILDKDKNNYMLASMFDLDKNKDYPAEKIYKDDNCTVKFNLEFQDLKNQFAIYKIGAYCNDK